jgi:hypothetical protein
MMDVRQIYKEREAAALELLYAAFYQYTGSYTQNFPISLVVSEVAGTAGSVVNFSTKDHFRARALREVNGELSLLPITHVTH